MDLSEPPRRAREENVIPMINVVFLLLIFFLMTAQIAPPEPFEVDPPATGSLEPSEGEFTLYVGPEGDIGFRDALGEEAALEALQLAYTEACADLGCFDVATRPMLVIRADAALEARQIPALLGKLAARDITRVQLATSEVFGDSE
ncbi:Biopolymer transport protein ExbD/TolR [Aquimixticola soesokkakensis]|uniref:Biopolymer transport protein ExbD/TolR n=1 Tax=Aquimixticola soesokkakensis TaxID=1519096 RepID=A0A1Y5T5Z6_9RHOB|nr:biopolymer transporter ExbD [Aquimixticola soesokkakensis]SLN56586.1 Biopolymer transport protein ExbD/TolR [Aquimixticola soesokkakensis]